MMKKPKTVRLPNLLIAGMSRCGTTSLYHYLKEHPDVFMSPVKEPSFFLSQVRPVPENGIGDDEKKYYSDRDDYGRLFERAGNCRAVGEASSENLYHAEKVIPHIQKHLGNPRIIISLRNPVDRAFSAYTFLISENREFLSFEEGLAQEEKRKRDGWRHIWLYRDAGFYYRGVKAYLENFPEVKVCLFDDLLRDPLSLVQDIFRFLAVDPSFVPDVSARYKTSGIPRSRRINRLFEEPTRMRSLARGVGKLLLKEDRWIKWRDRLKARSYGRAQMKPETRRYLEGVYRDDILKLQGLIGRDLRRWLTPGGSDGA
jgi:Sulfotransferase family